MNTERIAHRCDDCYDLMSVATALLTMSASARREAHLRRGAAELSRKLGRLHGHVEDFEIAAAVLEDTGARAEVCASRLRQAAQRLTGISPLR